MFIITSNKKLLNRYGVIYVYICSGGETMVVGLLTAHSELSTVCVVSQRQVCVMSQRQEAENGLI